MKHNGRLKVKFDFSFFAVVAFMIFIDTSGAAVLSLIACILHEGGHLLAMAVCGVNPERITFYGGGMVDYNIKCNTKNMDIILTFV